MSIFVANVQNTIDRVLAKRSDLHLLRKIWHIATGGLCLYGYYNIHKDIHFWAILIFIVSMMGFASDFMRMRYSWYNQLVITVMGPFMRSDERDGFTGLPFYALGASISLFVFKPQIALLSIFFLVFADPFSSLIGVLFGKDKILPNKSLQGALAGFVVCYLLTLLFILDYQVPGSQIFIFAVCAGVIGTISELISAFNIDDNLSIPVVSGLGLTLLNLIIPIF